MPKKSTEPVENEDVPEHEVVRNTSYNTFDGEEKFHATCSCGFTCEDEDEVKVNGKVDRHLGSS